MKKRNLYICGLISCLSVCSLLIAPLYQNNKDRNVLGLNCTHNGNHYLATDNYVEFWTCCNCNETFLVAPEIGTFKDNDVNNMMGGVPLIATIEKQIESLPTTLDSLSNFEKVKNANILYTLKNQILKLNEIDQSKLNLEKIDSIKEEYDSYITPIFGIDVKDTITPLNGSQIISVNKTHNATYGEMFDALFEENAEMKNHGMLLNNLNSSFSEYESIAFIAINDLYLWGENADKVNFQNNYTDVVSTNLPGSSVDIGYGNGTALMDVKFKETTSFIDPIINYQNTWGVTDNGHTHFYFTNIFGIRNSNFNEVASDTINSINKATSIVVSSNELAAQATLLAKTARDKYDALPHKIRDLVTNYDDLLTLEKTLNNYTLMLETTSIKLNLSDDSGEYSNYTKTTKIDDNYGNITHIKCNKKTNEKINININFDFSIGDQILIGYSKMIVFLRTPNLTSGISGAIYCGTPYLYLTTGTIKDSWMANTNQDINSSGQKLNGLRLLNIIPQWASDYGEIEISSFVLIKDNSNFTDLY